MVCSEAATLREDGILRPGFDAPRPAELVAGSPQNLEEEPQGAADDSLPLPFQRPETQIRAGRGQSVPTGPVNRKGSSAPDVLFFADPVASQGPAARLPAPADGPGSPLERGDRLFRPPRPAAY